MLTICMYMDIVRCNGSMTLYKHGIVIHVSHPLRCYSTKLAAILTCSDNGMKIEMLMICSYLKAIHWRLYAWGMVAEIATHIE